MQKRKELEKLQLFIFRVQQKGSMLRLFELSFINAAASRLLFP